MEVSPSPRLLEPRNEQQGHGASGNAHTEPKVSEPRNPEITSKIMSAVKNKDSEAELMLRRALFARRLRYRLHYKWLIGHPDIVFPSARLVVFVDGDFWHGNAWRLRGMASFEEQFHFRSNPDFWEAKIRRNMERDREVNEGLAEQGWNVVRVWESDILKDLEACVQRIVETIEVAAKRSKKRS